ncbi:hypothetical protein [Fructobacillus durionis]|uniref:SAM-dependent methyltransferase n=1 Tax=Fructobacillus durionis TaxID=283737 RepID=A0A1I1FEP8_9LACO|nr:hypothetical protein [Fructobacillus durionis]SFB95540.1 hypothetical protein SAMN05660453_0711 [Fructobacillus durionis]
MLDSTRLAELKERYARRTKQLRQIQAVEHTLNALEKQAIPDQPLPPLLYSERQLLRDPSLLPLDEAMSELRETVINKYGIWFLLNKEFLKDLATWLDGRPLIELAAGNAAISSGLHALGQQAIPIDKLDWAGQDVEKAEPWTPIKKQDALEAVKEAIQSVQSGQTDILPVFLLAWSPNGLTFDFEILKALRASGLSFDFIVIGEKGPSTNSQAFWDEAQLTLPAELNAHYQAFDAFNDKIYLAK